MQLSAAENFAERQMFFFFLSHYKLCRMRSEITVELLGRDFVLMAAFVYLKLCINGFITHVQVTHAMAKELQMK